MKRAFSIVLSIVLLVPASLFALTQEEIQARLQTLYGSLAQQQAQRVIASTTVSSTALGSAQGSICPSLFRTLKKGDRGTDVSSLQAFLVSERMISDESNTGYFGAITERALGLWQSRNGIAPSRSAGTSNGYGVLDDLTRKLIAASCKGPKMCPLYNTPPCSGGYLISQGVDAAGCNLPKRCSTGSNSCPVYSIPQCPNGTLISQGTDASGCARSPRCSTETISRCPVYAPPACPSGTQPAPGGLDGNGCQLPAQCVTGVSQQMTLSVTPAPGSNMAILPRVYTYTAQYAAGYSGTNTSSDTASYTIAYGDGTSASLPFGSVSCPVEGGMCTALFYAPNRMIMNAGTYTATVSRNGTPVASQQYTVN
ncbi:peptidoglycan-binding protein [bacterium]|nr:peptidoglycan-binding protein [bacterium]